MERKNEYFCKNTRMDQEKIILGIDPGTMVMGYGVIREQGKKLELLTMGVINLKKLENQALKLKKIFERVLEIINEYHPDELAIEAPFFGKNVQSMLKLGRAQGVAMAAALYRDIPSSSTRPRPSSRTSRAMATPRRNRWPRWCISFLRPTRTLSFLMPPMP